MPKTAKRTLKIGASHLAVLQRLQSDFVKVSDAAEFGEGDRRKILELSAVGDVECLWHLEFQHEGRALTLYEASSVGVIRSISIPTSLGRSIPSDTLQAHAIQSVGWPDGATYMECRLVSARRLVDGSKGGDRPAVEGQKVLRREIRVTPDSGSGGREGSTGRQRAGQLDY